MMTSTITKITILVVGNHLSMLKNISLKSEGGEGYSSFLDIGNT